MSNEMQFVMMYCPNCGAKNTGYKQNDESVKINCKKCGTILFSKKRNSQEYRIRMIRI